MRAVLLTLVAAALVGAAACSSSSSPTAPKDPITGSWSGEFDNGIPISVDLALTDTVISGTYAAGADSGTASGTYSPGGFSLQFTATTGTQRTLSNAQLLNNYKDIQAHWDDGAGLSGTLCLANPGPVASCP